MNCRPWQLFSIFALIFWLYAGGVRARAENWPSFRGPRCDGSSDERDLPVDFTKDRLVKWKTQLPGTGSSTPAVWNDAVFITSENETSSGVAALKINAASGTIEWSFPLSAAPPHDRRSDLATCSPATDGKVAIFVSGTGDLSARNFAGVELWKRQLSDDFGPFAMKWTYSSSPLIFEGLLFLEILQRDQALDEATPGRPSLLVALDPATGEEKWRQQRNSPAQGESREAYSTPIAFEYRGRKEIIVAGADLLTGHDPQSGAELWRWGSWNLKRVSDLRMVASPVLGDGVILACAPKGGPVYAIPAGESGALPFAKFRWRGPQAEVSSDIPSPLFYEDFFYILNGRLKVLSCVRPATGDLVWIERIPARAVIEASPVAADGKIYIISHTGEVFVFRTGEQFELLHETILGEDVAAKNRASIVPASGSLFVRVGSELWRLGK